MLTSRFFFMSKKVAIQGVQGSFHHLVCQRYFTSGVAIEPLLTFKQVVEALTAKKVDAARLSAAERISV